MEGVAIIGGMENFRKIKSKSVVIKGGRWEIDGLKIESTNLFICNSIFQTIHSTAVRGLQFFARYSELIPRELNSDSLIAV